jgi:predicted secreted protein
MTDARIGYGSKYIINGTQVAEVTEITPGEATVERVDATHMQSPGRRREYIAGMIDSGEASFSINWNPGDATDILLRGYLNSGAIEEHTIVFPNGVSVTFDAAVTGFSKVLPLEDRMTATVSIAVSGEETWGSEAIPANVAKPSITGASVQVGVTLSAVEGEFTNAPTSFTYQWQHDASGNGTFTNVSIGGTGETYVPVVGDIADFLRVGITPSNSAGAGTTVYSLPVGPIIAA